MQLTLLDMVQHILGAMGSDEVNSHTDTVESYQVAQLIRQCFYDCAVELNLPEHQTMFELNASVFASRPCFMTMPVAITKMTSVHYDNKSLTDTYSNMVPCKYLDFQEFFAMQNALSGETTNVGQQAVSNNGENFNFMFRNDAHPRFYTTTDDRVVIFDSYDVSIDSTLQKSKTMCAGVSYPTYTMTDTFIPLMDPVHFPYLLAKAKTRAFNELKQTINQESAAEARKQKIVLQKRKRSIDPETPLERLTVKYGR